MIVRNSALYAAPEGNKAPPLWIRGLLILTCTGVSFAHGSNDGQYLTSEAIRFLMKDKENDLNKEESPPSETC